MASTSANSATPAPPMPASLRQLVATVESLNVEHSPNTGSTAKEEPTPAEVATTASLLGLVNALQQQYAVLLEMAEKAYAPASGLRSGAAAAAEGELEEAAAQHMSDLETTAALLQQGIRSKAAQSTRLILLNSLRREVAERRQAVTKMEGVLSVARQHVRL